LKPLSIFLIPLSDLKNRLQILKLDRLLYSSSSSNIGSTSNKVADLISSNSIGRQEMH
jgi:hypothetical protein